MITFEFNQLPHNITNDQFATVAGIIQNDVGLDYDVVEGEEGRIFLWVHPFDDTINPTRHWIDVDGNVTLSEEVDWDWKGTS